MFCLNVVVIWLNEQIYKKITPNSDPRCFRGIKMEPICRCNEIAHVNVVKLGLFLILSILACLGCPHRQNGYMTYMGGVLTMYDGGLHGSLFLDVEGI